VARGPLGAASSDVDVVVAGAGAAGLAAALAAADSGASVLLLEARRTWRVDSNTAMSTGIVPAGGSRWQQEAGIEDSPEQFLADVMAKTKGTADPIVARTLTSVAPELVAWLADRTGVPFELIRDFNYPGHSAYRCHGAPDRLGSSLHRYLLAAAEAETAIDIWHPARLADAALDGSGALDEVAVETPDGRVEAVSATSVVLATNGFGADTERVAREIPEIADGLYFGGEGSRGDALVIGERLGAATACMDAYQGHGSVAVPEGVLVTWAAVMSGGVLVNAEGRRFGDESQGYSEFARLVLAQPGHHAWVVFDRGAHEVCLAFGDHQRLEDSGAIRWSDDVESLASTIGCPVEVLEATLATAASAAAGRAVDPFGRTAWPRPLVPPFAAVRCTGALFHTQGGLAVSEEAEVLRPDGQPIPGCFAAGGAAVGMSGHGASGYLAGNGLLAALGLGMVGGRAAARRARLRSGT
jgi:fumarate reductase flavoprotein subunit